MNIIVLVLGIISLGLGGFLFWKFHHNEKDEEKRTQKKKIVSCAIILLIAGIPIIIGAFADLLIMYFIGIGLILLGVSFIVKNRIKHKKDETGTVKKKRNFLWIILIILGFILAIIGFVFNQTRPPGPTTHEDTHIDVSFIGIDNNSTPLAATNMALIRTDSIRDSEVIRSTYRVIYTLSLHSRTNISRKL